MDTIKIMAQITEAKKLVSYMTEDERLFNYAHALANISDTISRHDLHRLMALGAVFLDSAAAEKAAAVTSHQLVYKIQQKKAG